MSDKYYCEACGKEQTREEYVAVGPSTPAAKHLGIDDTDRSHLVVCEECFKQASRELDEGGDE